MGLTYFKGEQVTKKDTEIAKNYLNEQELKVLNNIVSGYFDFAEARAIEQQTMTMQDYIRQLDAIMSADGRKLLSRSLKYNFKRRDSVNFAGKIGEK